MSERHIHTDNPRHRVSNPRITTNALRDKHGARAALAAQAVSGGKLTADQRQAAGDFLAAVLSIMSSDGPANTAVLFLLESVTAAIDLKRAAQQAS